MPKTPMLRVRNGKANKDALKKQRFVLTLIDWAAERCRLLGRARTPRFGHYSSQTLPHQHQHQRPRRPKGAR